MKKVLQLTAPDWDRSEVAVET